VLIQSSLFGGIDDNEVINSAIDKTILEMYTKDVKKGDVIIKQGDLGDALYIVEWGEFDIIVDEEIILEDEEEPRKERKTVGVINKGECVGESALMYSTKRNATIKANKPSRVWVMDSAQFYRIRDLIKELINNKLEVTQNFLTKIPLFSKMKQHELMNLTQACREVKFKAGQILVDKKKKPEEDLFIIRQGTAWVVRDRRNSIAICKEEFLSEEDTFMRKMLNSEPLSQVKAKSDMQCLKISKDDFDMLVAPYLNKHNEDGDSSDEDSEPTEAAELPKDVSNRVPFELTDFKPIVLAGVGSFGYVVLVKVEKSEDKKEVAPPALALDDGDEDEDEKPDEVEKEEKQMEEKEDEKKESNPKVYALKLVEKTKAINTGQTEHMKNERRVMFLLDSPFIVKLYATYKDETYVYFLLESVLGGELFTLLRRERSFAEPVARFYMGCVVLAFEHMHSHSIIYRDLKPENLLIDKYGYLKLTDFGFAKKRNQTTSLCGTPDYLAPELIQGLVQNFGVDWWCLGVLLFEMLVGRVPFRDTEKMKMYEHILKSRPVVPAYITIDAQDLIFKLLDKNSYKRLGSGPKGAKDIKAQNWFSKEFEDNKEFEFSWPKLEERSNKAPYVPELESEEDCRHFDIQQEISGETPLIESLGGDPSVFDWAEEF